MINSARSKNNEPLFILLVSSAILSYLSFSDILFPGNKKADMFSEIRQEPVKRESGLAASDKESKIAHAVWYRNSKSPKEFTDTISPVPVKRNAVTEEDKIINKHYLDSFFSALKISQSRKSKIRIAWFGDSMIEGDLITDDFRKLVQHKYGGNGVGFVGITSAVAQFRQSVRHDFSDDWTVYSFTNHPLKNISLGIGGFAFVSNPLSWVKYSATKSYGSFSNVRLICSNRKNNLLTIQTDAFSKTMILDSSSVLRTVSLNENSPVNRINIIFSYEGCVCYGIFIDNDSGLYVDNYSYRGNSGIPLSSIPQKDLKKLTEEENYKLIILSYGLNVVGHDLKKYSWYQHTFLKTLQYLKESFPGASFVLVSVGDKSYYSNGNYETEPDIPLFVEMQKKLADDAGISFWNLYEAMGGYNSMKDWVEKKPKLANSDYTHPNYAGAKKIASLFYNFLDVEYKKYLGQLKDSTASEAKIF